MVEPIVHAAGLTKIFRDFWGRAKAKAVNDVSFDVYPGEVVGLLGPNGSGKSTTVKMLLGLLYPSAGELSVYGRSPRAVETKLEIGYLPEESYLYRYLTAAETLDFFGSLFNLSKEERQRRIDQLLEMVGLEHARNRRVGEFSKGMARRIGLAQAMINDPSFLILDEPTAGLDPIGCREVKDLIIALKKRGKTVLITSHLLSDIEDVCDRVIILYGGKVRAEGTLDSLLTVQEFSRITTRVLQNEETKDVLSALQNIIKEGKIEITQPRRTLEEFFLDIVAQARRECVATSGAAAGGHIAEYLVNGDEKNETQVLSDLLNENKNNREDKDMNSGVAGTGEETFKEDVSKKIARLTAAVTEKEEILKEQENDQEEIKEAEKRLAALLDKRSDQDK